MKKTLVTLLCLILVTINPVYVCAQESKPKITNLEKDQKAPFGGVLLDQWAMAEIMTRLEISEKRHELVLEFELKKKEAEYKLQIDNLQLSLDLNDKQYGEILKIKEEELSILRGKAVEQKDYSSLWFAGGTAVGIILSVVVVWIFSEVMSKNLLGEGLDVNLQ